MKRVFFDSSVLVAATASLEGASALILGWCKNRKLAGYMSADVLGEAKKNVAFKLGASYLSRFEDIVEKSHLVLIPEPAVELISVCERVIHPKDAPILAAAVQSRADIILTFDRRHFLTKEAMVFAAPKKIMTPGDFIFRSRGGGDGERSRRGGGQKVGDRGRGRLPGLGGMGGERRRRERGEGLPA